MLTTLARSRLLAMLLFVAFFLVATSGCAVPSPPIATAATDAHPEANALSEQSLFVPGQLLVKFNDHVSVDRVAELLKLHDATVVRDYSEQQLFLIALPRDTSVEQGVRLFSKLAEVDFAEPNHIYRSED